ncbi:hypothetical protein [Flavobacterium pedocola]
MRSFLLFILFLQGILGDAQIHSGDLKLISTEPTTATLFIGKDSYGNTYSVQDNEVRKENPQSKLSYKNISLGKISQIDLQNPLQVVVFYKEMNAVVLLDSQLNETFRVNFSETNPELLPQQIGLAAQNRLWLFDLSSQKLGLYDYSKKTFSPVSVVFEHPIIYAQSDYNYFYWMDDQRKVFVSSLFGKINYLGTVPEHEAMQIISSKEILLRKGNVLSLFNLEKETSQIIPLNEKSLKSFYYKEQILSIFTDNEIRTYKITLP